MTETPMSIGDRARELLAAEWEAAGRPELAESIRKGREDEWSKAGPAIRAIEKALSPSPDAGLREALDGWEKDAAIYTLEDTDHPIAARDEDGCGIQHAAWMLEEIVTGKIAGRKAHRWLGYAQALLVSGGWLTLDEAKLANKRASDAAALRSRSIEDSTNGQG
jgi:hypothetical protein